jgi:hypothetical protein
MRTSELKNRIARNGVNMESSDERYTLRSRAMSVLYDCKKRGFVLPRVEIRILETADVCAYAYTGKNIVHINKKYMTEKYNPLFEQIVLHELVHAIFGIGEVDGCKLMHCSKFWVNKPTNELAWKLFTEYYNKWNSSK